MAAKINFNVEHLIWVVGRDNFQLIGGLDFTNILAFLLVRNEVNKYEMIQ
jgi:hypothetical protein